MSVQQRTYRIVLVKVGIRAVVVIKECAGRVGDVLRKPGECLRLARALRKSRKRVIRLRLFVSRMCKRHRQSCEIYIYRKDSAYQGPELCVAPVRCSVSVGEPVYCGVGDNNVEGKLGIGVRPQHHSFTNPICWFYQVNLMYPIRDLTRATYHVRIDIGLFPMANPAVLDLSEWILTLPVPHCVVYVTRSRVASSIAFAGSSVVALYAGLPHQRSTWAPDSFQNQLPSPTYRRVYLVLDD